MSIGYRFKDKTAKKIIKELNKSFVWLDEADISKARWYIRELDSYSLLSPDDVQLIDRIIQTGKKNRNFIFRLFSLGALFLLSLWLIL
ncbi:hypothetical protein [Fictibacillus sp. NRS-1165]|uniref:hypothetical protein n=1 Tax=Fictibacillus sp. NRS-1165 TaxID=3144463 RepID=UPI003D1BF13F